jgi:hypothetical protein
LKIHKPQESNTATRDLDMFSRFWFIRYSQLNNESRPGCSCITVYRWKLWNHFPLVLSYFIWPLAYSGLFCTYLYCWIKIIIPSHSAHLKTTSTPKWGQVAIAQINQKNLFYKRSWGIFLKHIIYWLCAVLLRSTELGSNSWNPDLGPGRITIWPPGQF